MSSVSSNTNFYTKDEVASRMLLLLDAQDGDVDNRITKKEWNNFAEYSGLVPTDKEFVSIQEANAGFDILMSNNSAKVVNYARSYFNEEIYIEPENNANASSTANTYDNNTSSHNDIASKALRKFIQNSDISTVRNFIRVSSDLASLKYPLAAKLLRLSVTPDELYIKDYDDYSVLSAQSSKKKLAELGMYQDDTSSSGAKNEHLTSEKMKLKTVVFNKNSEVSKVLSRTKSLKTVSELWESKGKPSKKYYAGKLDESTDCLMGINSCLVTLISVKDNGKSLIYSGYVEDVYDYSEHYAAEENSIKSKVIDKMNYGAYLAQEKGALENYRVLIPFEVEVQKK